MFVKNSLFLNIHACCGEDLKIVLEKSYFSKSEVFSLALYYSTPGRPEENGFEMTPGERGGDRGRRGRGRGQSFVGGLPLIVYNNDDFTKSCMCKWN